MRRNFTRLFLLLLAVSSFPRIASGRGEVESPPQAEAAKPEDGTGSAVCYTISLSVPAQHLLHVRLKLPAGRATQELQMPVWNALYQVRDFAQYINWLRATNTTGAVLPVHQLNDSRWQVSGTEAGVVVDYEVFADTPGPFNAQLNSHHAFLNLAQVLMYPVADRSSEMTVEFKDLPVSWRIATPLQAVSSKTFRADNYDRLVDSPVEIGEFQESDFDESGGHYRVIVDADAADYELTKIDGDLHKIVAAATGWMNDRPFDTYTFIYHFPHGPAGGGMEHSYSTAIDVSAETLKANPGALASVTAHEFFHLWNVKRIRPQSLEPVDYTEENRTPALWFSEGCTSTAADIIEFRAGLTDEKQFLDHLSDEISELERRPAHATQSVEDSSMDAWLEGYPYYRRPERSISYYNKGELLGVMLDLELREASNGRASLRELFQWMNQHYTQKGKFFDDGNGVREAGEAVTHRDLSAFFSRYVSATNEIPWNDFMNSVGLRVIRDATTQPDAGFSASRNFDGPMRVDSVDPGSEAERAGLRVGETVVEIQGNPAGSDSSEEVSQMKPGDTITVKIRGFRSGEREVKWKISGRQQVMYQIKDLETVTAAQRSRRAQWLKGEAETGAASDTAPEHAESAEQ